ncbi:MAG TPA: helix-turn-helix transcriptional regulator [Candidatus Onthoplasma faecigallinarum]|nr:helix-turn-helix transcriptional regulator [Candidatus Onthoplasma faecigallinarum]
MIKEKFGKRIKKLRKEKTDLSQENFAYLIGMDRTYYSSIENGNRNVSLINIEKIAKGLKITLSELFENIENE